MKQKAQMKNYGDRRSRELFKGQLVLETIEVRINGLRIFYLKYKSCVLFDKIVKWTMYINTCG